MKIYPKIILLIVMALFLSACGSDDVDVALTEGASIEDVYTAVAMTLAAQPSEPTSTTIAALPSPTSVIVQSPTTVVLSTPTLWNISTNVVYSTANGCYNAVYVSDVTIVDGTVLAPTEEFVKTWKFQNTGSCEWSEDFLITFSSGEDMDGEDTEIDDEVAAGDTDSISVSLIAPDDEGTYTGYWQLATDDGTLFGERVYVLIVVSEDATTSTPTTTTTATATMTATAIATPTYAAEATATYTLVPTNTFTPVPTDTFTPESETDSTSVSDDNSGETITSE